MKLNLPTWLTLGRIIAIPVMVVCFLSPSISLGHILAAFIFVLASITDWLDGYLARTRNEISNFGAFLDPVADKLLVTTALILLVSQPFTPYLAVPAIIIAGRELLISALREWMAELGKRTSVAVSWIGKLKTGFQMVAVACLLAYYPGAWLFIAGAGYILIYLAALMTLWSMFIYLKAAWPEFIRES